MTGTQDGRPTKSDDCTGTRVVLSSYRIIVFRKRPAMNYGMDLNVWYGASWRAGASSTAHPCLFMTRQEPGRRCPAAGLCGEVAGMLVWQCCLRNSNRWHSTASPKETVTIQLMGG